MHVPVRHHLLFDFDALLCATLRRARLKAYLAAILNFRVRWSPMKRKRNDTGNAHGEAAISRKAKCGQDPSVPQVPYITSDDAPSFNTTPVRRSGRTPKPKVLDGSFVNDESVRQNKSHVAKPPGANGLSTATNAAPAKARRTGAPLLPNDFEPALTATETPLCDEDEIEQSDPGVGSFAATPQRASAPAADTTNGIRSAADRSAKRKSSRRLMREQEAADGYSDPDEELAQRILEDGSDMELDAEDTIVLDASGPTATAIRDTPSKRKAGRPKGSKNRRTPTPPPNMPPYEHYFFQNRPGASKTSNNTLSSLSLLTHEEYFSAMRRFKDPHQDELDFLQDLHERAFEQWTFELDQGFSVCLHGLGSKWTLLSTFADHVYVSVGDAPPHVVVIKGFDAFLTVRDIFNVLATTIPSLHGQKLGAQPADMLSTVLAALESAPPQRPTLLIIHSLDSLQLRRSTTQALLGRLASSPHVQVIASCDTPNFGLLWDSNLRSQFNFVFHDATTFQPFEQEIQSGGSGGGVIEELLTLLNRSGRRVHGKEGVVFVLRSLTESARRLFGLLVSEILSLDVEDVVAPRDHANGGEDDFESAVSGRPAGPGPRPGALGGIEYRSLYRKAVQQLITGSEISFGQLLKEFYDHQMIVSRRDGAGTEMLTVPFRREECEAILEDLVTEM